MLNSSFWRDRRVLLTGHTGFKGSWLTLWLLSLGAEVWGYALAPPPGRSLFIDLGLDKPIGDTHHLGRLHHLLGDVCDFQALQHAVEQAQPEVVLHLAAQPLVRLSYRDPLGTWLTNVQGSLHLLEALRALLHPCAVVMVTTDKVYANHEWDYGYRENDLLGGHDPYSASKAAAEIAISSWRSSFCGTGSRQTPYLSIATARAGNVIGGGDWAEDRIIPDAMRSLAAGKPIHLRFPDATRPWQHVLEPLGGYLMLAEKLAFGRHKFSSAFNFGPMLESNRSVRELAEEVLAHWPGACFDRCNHVAPHEAGRLHLQIDKAFHQLGWYPRWPFSITVERTVNWYRTVHEGSAPLDCCQGDLQAYTKAIMSANC